MLGLHYETPPTWAKRVLANPAELMLDHLFCEKKAAAMALHTLRCHGDKYPTLKPLMKTLAAEEMEHATRCENFLKDMPRPFHKLGGNRYALGLRKLWRQEGNNQFLDTLLVCSLIEARSAERFKLLADEAQGSTLGNFYSDLYASEVNHYTLFVELGTDFFGDEQTQKRLNDMRAGEAKLIQALPEGIRIH